jgi:hypothetical protein
MFYIAAATILDTDSSLVEGLFHLGPMIAA